MIFMSAQSSLSHWMTVRPGMEAGSMGTTALELAAADHHAAGVLPEMTRQVLHPLAEFNVLGDAGMLNVKARIVKVAAERVVLVSSTPRR